MLEEGPLLEEGSGGPVLEEGLVLNEGLVLVECSVLEEGPVERLEELEEGLVLLQELEGTPIIGG